MDPYAPPPAAAGLELAECTLRLSASIDRSLKGALTRAEINTHRLVAHALYPIWKRRPPLLYAERVFNLRCVCAELNEPSESGSRDNRCLASELDRCPVCEVSQ